MCQYSSCQWTPLVEQSPLFTAFDAPILQSGLWFGIRPFVMSQSVPPAGLISGLHSSLCDAEPEAAAPASVNELVMSTLQGNQPLACTCERACEWTGERQLARLSWPLKSSVFKGPALKPFLVSSSKATDGSPESNAFYLALCLIPPTETPGFSFWLKLRICLTF